MSTWDPLMELILAVRCRLDALSRDIHLLTQVLGVECYDDICFLLGPFCPAQLAYLILNREINSGLILRTNIGTDVSEVAKKIVTSMQSRARRF